MEHADIRQILGLVTGILKQWLQDDVGQVRTHDGMAVAGLVIQGGPALRAARAALILNDQILTGDLAEERWLKKGD